MSDSNYYKNFRPEVMAFVPRNSVKILEIGCGKGAFRGNFPADVEYWGVEPHKQSAILASIRMTRVLGGDFFGVAHEIPSEYFDLIVCNDVIEHIVDTGRLMLDLRGKLKADGYLVGSIPNVRHAEVIHNLIFKKDWRYQGSGVLDRTHVRFYTQKSIRELLVEYGFEIESMSGVNVDVPWGDDSGPLKRSIISRMLGADSRALQFAFRARKVAMPSKNPIQGQVLSAHAFGSREDFHAYLEANAEELRARKEVDAIWGQKAPDEVGAENIYNGYCGVCLRHQHFLFKGSEVVQDGWRNQLVCVGCDLDGESRLTQYLIGRFLALNPRAAIYLTEQVTELAGAVENVAENLTCSEFVEESLPSGTLTRHHVRHELPWELSFADRSFDALISLNRLSPDVDHRKVIGEMARVTSDKGFVIFGLNFDSKADLTDSVSTILKVSGSGGGPSRELSNQKVFGWDVLAIFEEAGFQSVKLVQFWSSDLANLGGDNFYLVARKIEGGVDFLNGTLN